MDTPIKVNEKSTLTYIKQFFSWIGWCIRKGHGPYIRQATRDLTDEYVTRRCRWIFKLRYKAPVEEINFGSLYKIEENCYRSISVYVNPSLCPDGEDFETWANRLSSDIYDNVMFNMVHDYWVPAYYPDIKLLQAE